MRLVQTGLRAGEFINPKEVSTGLNKGYSPVNKEAILSDASLLSLSNNKKARINQHQ
jgi:hypothetical protein